MQQTKKTLQLTKKNAGNEKARRIPQKGKKKRRRMVRRIEAEGITDSGAEPDKMQKEHRIADSKREAVSE